MAHKFLRILILMFNTFHARIIVAYLHRIILFFDYDFVHNMLNMLLLIADEEFLGLKAEALHKNWREERVWYLVTRPFSQLWDTISHLIKSSKKAMKPSFSMVLERRRKTARLDEVGREAFGKCVNIKN